MIRRVLTTSVAALFLAAATPALADAQVSLYVAAGPSIPIGDLGDVAGTGWVLAGGLTFPLGENGLWTGVEGTYGRNGLDNSTVDGHVRLIGLMALLGYTIPTESSVHPYVWGGAGILSGSVEVDGFDGGESDSDFGFQAGVGTTFGHGTVRPLIEARLETAGSEKQFFAIDAGATFALGN